MENRLAVLEIQFQALQSNIDELAHPAFRDKLAKMEACHGKNCERLKEVGQGHQQVLRVLELAGNEQQSFKKQTTRRFDDATADAQNIMSQLRTLMGMLETVASSPGSRSNRAPGTAAATGAARNSTGNGGSGNAAIERQVQDLQAKLERAGKNAERAVVQLEKAQARNQAFEDRIRELTAERDEALERGKGSSSELEQLNAHWKREFAELQGANAEIQSIMRSELEAEQLRRRNIFELYQGLKGSIRVMCRIRPAPSGVPTQDLVDFGAPESGEHSSAWGRMNLVCPRKKYDGTLIEEVKRFDFERIFGQEDVNDDVFNEISDLAQCALYGQKVCIFAYGQSGSGKTFTMSSDDGVIPRTFQLLFEAKKGASAGETYRIEMSAVEIYLNDVHDLLHADSGPDERPCAGKLCRLKVPMDQVQLHQIDAWEGASALLESASRTRSAGVTNLNEHSSRSHLIVTVKITRKTALANGKARESSGILNLIDLAGSERAGAAGTEGQQLSEGIAINKSLTSLNLAITALGQGKTPSYDSALTKALRPCLREGCRTLMFVMVSPMKKDLSVTVQTLEKGQEATKAKLASVKRERDGAKPPQQPAAANESPAARPSRIPKAGDKAAAEAESPKLRRDPRSGDKSTPSPDARKAAPRPSPADRRGK